MIPGWTQGSGIRRPGAPGARRWLAFMVLAWLMALYSVQLAASVHPPDSVVERFVQHRAHAREHAVDDEAGRVRGEHRRLAQLADEGGRGRERLVAGALRADQLDERHHGDRVEEVDTDEPLRVRELGAHLGHRER